MSRNDYNQAWKQCLLLKFLLGVIFLGSYISSFTADRLHHTSNNENDEYSKRSKLEAKKSSYMEVPESSFVEDHLRKRTRRRNLFSNKTAETRLQSFDYSKPKGRFEGEYDFITDTMREGENNGFHEAGRGMKEVEIQTQFSICLAEDENLFSNDGNGAIQLLQGWSTDIIDEFLEHNLLDRKLSSSGLKEQHEELVDENDSHDIVNGVKELLGGVEEGGGVASTKKNSETKTTRTTTTTINQRTQLVPIPRMRHLGVYYDYRIPPHVDRIVPLRYKPLDRRKECEGLSYVIFLNASFFIDNERGGGDDDYDDGTEEYVRHAIVNELRQTLPAIASSSSSSSP